MQHIILLRLATIKIKNAAFVGQILVARGLRFTVSMDHSDSGEFVNLVCKLIAIYRDISAICWQYRLTKIPAIKALLAGSTTAQLLTNWRHLSTDFLLRVSSALPRCSQSLHNNDMVLALPSAPATSALALICCLKYKSLPICTRSMVSDPLPLPCRCELPF